MKRLKRSLLCVAAFVFCAFIPAIPSPAATSGTTVEFLTKLNGYYYCLSREGLKDYHCDLTCSLSADTESQLRAKGNYDEKLWGAVGNFRFSVDDAADNSISIQGSVIPKTGDAESDAKAAQLEGNIQELVKAFLEFWKALVLEPLNDPNDANQGNLKFQRGSDGFKIIQTDPSGEVMTGTFDKKGKLLELSTTGGTVATTIRPDFIYSAKGYLLTGLAISAPGASQNCKVGYKVVGRYWMPKGLGVRVRLPGMAAADIGLIFNFVNYRVDP